MENTAVLDPATEAPPGHVRVDLLDPSPLNRKSASEEEGILSLVASIEEVGLLSPIAARPMPDGRLEIIYGEGRWRAFTHMGREFIPCTVKEITEAQAQVERVTENLKRKALTPLEEGEGVLAYLQLNDFDYAEAAAQFGQTENWIRRRAKLPALIPEWREAFATETYKKLGKAIERVEELAMLPPETQKALLEDGYLQYVSTTAQMRERIAGWCRNLEKKPWTRAWEKETVSSSKRCDKCLTRSDREATLFADLHASMDNDQAKLCLDPACWQDRTVAFCKDLIAENKSAIPLWDGHTNPKAERLALEEFAAKLPSYWEWDDVDPEEEMPAGKREQQAVFIGGPRAGQLVTVWMDDDIEEEEEPDAELEARRARQQQEYEDRSKREDAVEEKAEEFLPSDFDGFKAIWGCDDLTALASLMNWAVWFGIHSAEYYHSEEDDAVHDYRNLSQQANPVLDYAWKGVRNHLVRLFVDTVVYDPEDRSCEPNDEVILADVCAHLGIDLEAVRQSVTGGAGGEPPATE